MAQTYCRFGRLPCLTIFSVDGPFNEASHNDGEPLIVLVEFRTFPPSTDPYSGFRNGPLKQVYGFRAGFSVSQKALEINEINRSE